MDDVQKEILINQLVMMNQLAALYKPIAKIYRLSGIDLYKEEGKCKLLDDRVKITRKLIKENES